MEEIKAIKCPGCGSIDIKNVGNGVGKCAHCNSTLILPRQNEEILALLNTAYLYRVNSNYDLAIKTYQFILEKDSSELSAYEGIILSEYGIEYVKDSYSNKLVPTCHRAHFTSIYDNQYYKTLITLANEEQKQIIEEKAKEIDKLQKAIERQLNNEKEYDIFISYKATDSDGEKTEDSLIAREIYEELIKKNYKVFFAEKSLEDRIGSEYEPIIFKALHTSKVFVLVGTSKENVESNWVRNEWSRYIDRIQIEEDLHRSSFIPVFKDMNPYDMPKINNAFVQGVDASKIGYLTTLIDGIQKILKPEKEQKLLSSFENLDTYLEFTKIQKQNNIELRTRRWQEFKKSKGIKKWLYFLFLYSPLILGLPYLIFASLTDSHLSRGKFYVFNIFLMITMLLMCIIPVCIHVANKFKVNRFLNIFVPILLFVVGEILYFTTYFMYPITLCGNSAMMVGSYYRGDGYYYCTQQYNRGSSYRSLIYYIDSNGKYKEDIKEENGKKVYYLPKEVDGYDVEFFGSNVLPEDVQILVVPNY